MLKYNNYITDGVLDGFKDGNMSDSLEKGVVSMRNGNRNERERDDLTPINGGMLGLKDRGV